MDTPHTPGDADTPVRVYTFTLGYFSGDLAAVTLRMPPARVRVLLRDLERLLAAAPEAVVEVPCLGALRREAHGS